MSTRPLTPAQRFVLDNITDLHRRMWQGYRYSINGQTVRAATVARLFDLGLIRTNGAVGVDMTFTLTDNGRSALEVTS